MVQILERLEAGNVVTDTFFLKFLKLFVNVCGDALRLLYT